jgi:hypothetical protein
MGVRSGSIQSWSALSPLLREAAFRMLSKGKTLLEDLGGPSPIWSLHPQYLPPPFRLQPTSFS